MAQRKAKGLKKGLTRKLRKSTKGGNDQNWLEKCSGIPSTIGETAHIHRKNKNESTSNKIQETRPMCLRPKLEAVGELGQRQRPRQRSNARQIQTKKRKKTDITPDIYGGSGRKLNGP